MRKILVIGSGGAGKSELSKTLGQILKIPVYHLDSYFWQPGWVEPNKETWRTTVTELVKNKSWILDGNYGGTFDIRFPAADTIIFLNYSRWLCLYRVIKRRLKYHNKTRPDLTPGCNEQVNFEFFKWIWSFPGKKAPLISKQLAALNLDIIELHNQKEANIFLNKVKGNFGN